MPTEVDWARLAMAIDAEGTIDIQVYRDKSTKPGKVYVGDRMRVLIANTDPRLPLWCQQKFGAHISRCKYQYKKHHRPCFKWIIMANKALFVLQNCLPYLLLKKDQAELAIAWQLTKTRKYARKGVPEAVRANRIALDTEIKRLKHIPLDHFYEKPN